MISRVCTRIFQQTKFNNFLSQKSFFFSMDQAKKDQYGRPYPDYKKYPCPVLTVDAVVIRENKDNKQPEVLLCTRGIEPHKGLLVLPGGHVDYNEAPEHACLRELKEEADLDGTSAELLTVKGDALRDSRKHTVTVAYLVKVKEDQQPKGGDDATDAKFYPLGDVLAQKSNIGFDHFDILQCAVEKLKLNNPKM